ncbi:protoporphyrinogen oxidase HemJ [Chitinibacter sp. S2-10]|uniref:protoporphyrinogen oxidase HemJ n=1 Tax=Chitinibacter sp. S2-10 TaxID=3373597 RepID=UPI0039775949
MENAMLWVKSFHIIFVISWFAGLFYLPRIFVNQAMASEAAEQTRLGLMARKLYRFMTPIAILALIFGLWNWSFYGFYLGQGWAWMHVKLTLVTALIAYHAWCGKIYRDFAAGKNTRSHLWYRVFNEVPVLILIAVVILVVVKPF